MSTTARAANPMTITFEITQETAALIWADNWRKAQSKAELTEFIAKIAKSHLEHKADHYKANYPVNAHYDIKSFQSLPE